MNGNYIRDSSLSDGMITSTNPTSMRVSAERYKQLKKEFDMIDTSGDKRITYDELHTFLSRQSGANFDHALLQELFDKMDVNRDGHITVDEFIDSYIEAENLILGRIDLLRKQIADNTRQMEAAKRQEIETQAAEQLNEYGIMKGSILTVHVMQARELKAMDLGGTADPYVKLSCEKQFITTQIMERTTSPVWNEMFTFNIAKGTEELLVEVLNRDVFRSNDFLGQVRIPLSLLKNQMKHEQWFKLTGRKAGELWQGSIQLGLQWIWSRSRYLAEVVKQWEENIDLDKTEVEMLQAQLKKLQDPFTITASKGAWIHVGEISQLKEIEKVVIEKVDHVVGSSLGNRMEWTFASEVSTYILMTFAVFSSYARSDFLSLSIAMLAGITVFTHSRSSINYKFISFMLFVSAFLDLVWLTIFSAVRYI
jgi:hypothetical protein